MLLELAESPQRYGICKINYGKHIFGNKTVCMILITTFKLLLNIHFNNLHHAPIYILLEEIKNIRHWILSQCWGCVVSR